MNPTDHPMTQLTTTTPPRLTASSMKSTDLEKYLKKILSSSNYKHSKHNKIFKTLQNQSLIIKNSYLKIQFEMSLKITQDIHCHSNKLLKIKNN
jgi:hypothetical protein